MKKNHKNLIKCKYINYEYNINTTSKLFVFIFVTILLTNYIIVKDFANCGRNLCVKKLYKSSLCLARSIIKTLCIIKC